MIAGRASFSGLNALDVISDILKKALLIALKDVKHELEVHAQAC